MRLCSLRWIGTPSRWPRTDWNCPHDQRTVWRYQSANVCGSIVQDERLVDVGDPPKLLADDLSKPVHVVDRVRGVLFDQLREHPSAEDGVRAADDVDNPQRVLAALDRHLVRPVHERAHRDHRVPALRVVPYRCDPAGAHSDPLVAIHLCDDQLEVVGRDRRVVVEDGDVVVTPGKIESARSRRAAPAGLPPLCSRASTWAPASTATSAVRSVEPSDTTYTSACEAAERTVAAIVASPFLQAISTATFGRSFKPSPRPG